MSSVSEKERAFLAIREAIFAGAKAFLSAFKRDWAGEEMFGFLLVAVWEGYCVEAVAGTEEGLLRGVHEYAERKGKRDDDEYIQAEYIKSRWDGYEDGWYENLDDAFFGQANQLISEAHDSGLMEMGDQQLQQICIEAFKALDSDHVFGVGEAREKITIGVSDVGGDHAQEDFLSWAEPVNPPVVMERLRHDLQKANELFQAESALRRKAREANNPDRPDSQD
ncbi:MAG: DUF4303 domain-containing protein [Kovacikia sp.]